MPKVTRGKARSETARNVPPLVIVSIALLLLLALLPSALNLPQSTPSETLEYAPVPPEDDSSTPPAGNFSSLGLGSSASPGDAATGAADGGAGSGGGTGVGKNPSTKRCVGSPPRQTEDPLAPPCVAHFNGDNFGATYRGVTGDEIRVLIYATRQPWGSRFDLGGPPVGDEPGWIGGLRAYQRYFNERYQTYGRFVRFFVRTDSGVDPGPSPESRRSDAADDAGHFRPFAAIASSFKYNDVYAAEMARRGVFVIVGNAAGGSNGGSFATSGEFRRFPGLIWSYSPSVEHRAKLFVTYVCKKVVPFRVSFSGNAADRGLPRRLGLIVVTDERRPDQILFGRLVRDGLRSCGANVVAEGTLPSDGFGGQADYEAGFQNAALFRQERVTTVIQAAGTSVGGGQTKPFGASGYRPEWVLAGDYLNDANIAGQEGLGQDQTVWANARVVSLYTRATDVERQACFEAAREGDPAIPRSAAKGGACLIYPDLRMLFTGIQVAGPRLGPPTIDRGYHAIPAVASSDPTVPACFFDAGDYACVKDAQVQWWDPTGIPPDDDGQGCWRSMEGARRYLAGTWPDGDVEAQRDPAKDQCNYQGLSVDGQVGDA